MLIFQYTLKYWPRFVECNMQEAYKAIADPTRRRILKYLRGGERTAGELAKNAGVGRTALSHHLMVLKLADLVRVERRGQFQVYSLNTTVFQDLLTEIIGWLGGMEDHSEPVAEPIDYWCTDTHLAGDVSFLAGYRPHPLECSRAGGCLRAQVGQRCVVSGG